MSGKHVLVVTGEGPWGGEHGIGDLDWSIECSTPKLCHGTGWIECGEPHPLTPCDDCPFTDDCAEEGLCGDVGDGDESWFHGEIHTWHHGYGWTMTYPGCVVIDNAGGSDDASDIATTVGPGRWVVEDDWFDTEMALLLVGPDELMGGEQA